MGNTASAVLEPAIHNSNVPSSHNIAEPRHHNALPGKGSLPVQNGLKHSLYPYNPARHSEALMLQQDKERLARFRQENGVDIGREAVNSQTSITASSNNNLAQQHHHHRSPQQGTFSHNRSENNTTNTQIVRAAQHAPPSTENSSNTTNTPAKSEEKDYSYIDENNDSSFYKFLVRVHKDDFLSNKMPILLNGVSLAMNLSSGLGDYLLAKDSPLRKTLDLLGDLGYRAFLMINGTSNFVDQYIFGNRLSAFSNFMENVVALTVKRDLMYIVRAFIVAGYSVANAFNTIVGKDKYDDLDDYMKSTRYAFKTFLTNLFTNPIKSLLSPDSGVLAIVAPLISALGPIVYFMTGSEKAATWFRTAGGLLTDAEKLHPGHVKNGKFFYPLAGASYMLGTGSDFYDKSINKSPLAVTANIICDSLGRIFLREANVRGETAKRGGNIDLPKNEDFYEVIDPGDEAIKEPMKIGPRPANSAQPNMMRIGPRPKQANQSQAA